MKKSITLEMIKALNPCQGRLDNYVKHYGTKTFSKGQFMGLKNITQSDKMWVAFRMMSKENIKLAAADIAETVLPLYEKKYPGDDRPRKAIEAARTGTVTGAIREAAWEARRAAYAAAYAAADAYAAAYAAADAAYAAADAAYAAADAAADAYAAAYAAADAAYAAADAAADAAYRSDRQVAREVQEKLIRKIVLKYWK